MLLIIRTFIVVAVAWIATAVATYELAIWLVPARTSDGHPVMPMAQAGLAALVATLVAAIVVGLTIRKARRRLTAPPP